MFKVICWIRDTSIQIPSPSPHFDMLLRRRLRCELRRKVSRAVALGRVPSVDQLIMSLYRGSGSLFGDKVHWFQRNILYFFENPWKSSDRFTDSGRFKVLSINHLLLTSMQSFRNMILQKEKHGGKKKHGDKRKDLQDIHILWWCKRVIGLFPSDSPKDLLLDCIRYSGQGLDKFWQCTTN